MLGQQGWRILSSPESLCARDLKGRYFPQGVFWHAEAPRSTSYTWRNILFGRELLKHGVQWALAMVRRFESSVTTVFPPRRHTCSNRSSRSRQMLLFGASWMMIDLGTWNKETIHAFFHADIASEIMQLPVSRHGGDDYTRWPHNKFGEYPVRSAYNLWLDQTGSSKLRAPTVTTRRQSVLLQKGVARPFGKSRHRTR